MKDRRRKGLQKVWYQDPADEAITRDEYEQARATASPVRTPGPRAPDSRTQPDGGEPR